MTEPDPVQSVTSVVPYLCAHDAEAALGFYERAFGAVVHSRWKDESGRMGHSEFSIGAAPFFLSDEWPELGVVSPKSLGGAPMAFVLTVADADALFAQARAAGATESRPLTDEFDGRRSGWLTDPFGFRWNITSAGPEQSLDQLQSAAGEGWTITP